MEKYNPQIKYIKAEYKSPHFEFEDILNKVNDDYKGLEAKTFRAVD